MVGDVFGVLFVQTRGEVAVAVGGVKHADRVGATWLGEEVGQTSSRPTSSPEWVAMKQPEAEPHDVRLRTSEERVMNLKGYVEATEAEREGLRALRARLETAVARAAAVEEECGVAEAAARATVVPPS